MGKAKDQQTLAVTVRVGELLFQFTTFEQWVAKAASWFRNSGVSGDDCLCLDAANRVCRVGKQFLRARDEDSFPIRVYKAIIDLGAERMSEAEKIEELIAAYRMAVGDWAMSLEERGFAMMNRTEDALRDKIQSIITERDALRKVAQSHRGKQ